MNEMVVHRILEVMIFIFGSVVGSFLNVCIWRIPRDQSIIRPGSHCPKCNAHIAWYDNIPLLSYLLLRARCRHCGERISIRYPLVEALTAVLFLLLYLRFSLSVAFAVYAALVASFIIVAFVDIEHYIIPNRISLGGTIAGVALGFTAKYFPDDRFIVTDTVQALAGGIVFPAILYLLDRVSQFIFKKPGMGGGDVKLAAVIGLFVGFRLVFAVILVASVVGSILGLLILSLRKTHEDDPSHYIPFGPYLVLGAIVVLFFSQDILNFWTNLTTIGPGY